MSSPHYPCAFIPDGQDLEAYIEGIEGICPPVWFKYRPMRLQEGITAYRTFERGSPEDKARVVGAAMDSLRDWDVAGPDGRLVPCTKANAQCLIAVVATNIAHVIWGVGYSSRPPQRTPAGDAAAARVAAESLATGQHPTVTREAQAAGNS